MWAESRPKALLAEGSYQSNLALAPTASLASSLLSIPNTGKSTEQELTGVKPDAQWHFASVMCCWSTWTPHHLLPWKHHWVSTPQVGGYISSFSGFNCHLWPHLACCKGIRIKARKFTAVFLWHTVKPSNYGFAQTCDFPFGKCTNEKYSLH